MQTEIFGDDVMAAALIDRLRHHWHIVSIRVNSYRMGHHTELYRALARARATKNSAETEGQQSGGADALRLVTPSAGCQIFDRPMCHVLDRR